MQPNGSLRAGRDPSRVRFPLSSISFWRGSGMAYDKKPFFREAVIVLVMAAAMPVFAADGIKSLTLGESIDLALKQSVLIHAAKEGVRGAEALQREAFTG